MSYHHRTTCRGCGSKNLTGVMDLGTMPPANAFVSLKEISGEKSYPLALYFCDDCSLAQLLDVVDPRILFGDYPYVTGANAPLVEHFKRYADKAVRPLIRSEDDIVVDVGGNDGLLCGYVKQFARAVNVDPAQNLEERTLDRGAAFLGTAFDLEASNFVKNFYGRARVVTANNVLAHTDDPLEMLQAVADLLVDDGTLICEVQWAKNLIDDASYDHVYHEHLSYFTLHSLRRLIGQAGLDVYDVEVVRTQGQSLRVYASRERRRRSDALLWITAQECGARLTEVETFVKFGRRARQHAHVLKELLGDVKLSGAQVVGYGAPAKSSTLLNFAGIGRDVLDYIADATPLKHGLYGPGHHVSVVPVADLHEDEPDYAVLFAWNYKSEILAREHRLREKGTKFIVPIPNIEIV